MTYFSKFRADGREFKANLEVIKLSDQKKEIFASKLLDNQNELRKKLGMLGNDVTPVYKDLKWRFDVQVASRTFDEELKPKIMLQLRLENNDGTE